MDITCRASNGAAEAEPNSGPESNFDMGRKFEAKTRKCLMCGETFKSEWAGERVCKSCKSTSAWRTG